ncbi:GNAT family N-acetyltransferase [Haliscomenobacter hydrossis]|uniref:GCN5-related N-acetyltransferase n=1 Tax=Haliscomenobacter hydrossis (strain ATCC 27775 / DSM 1100 / LMG 10767 / O) TaxID=760192 RepID=F4KRH6_HALH1|nr:GNAT family N-acetyltransferase [Haliscomenobacter hydrossis]AEE47966.1 GCN5-related N-acetyltransferase [Haliscomenobacter hydrossis DSM 1100]
MTEILQTDRLILRTLTLDDATFIVELVNSPGWIKYIGYRNINTLEDARNYLNNGPLKSYVVYGFGLWAIVLKDEGIPIGMCGLIKRDGLEDADLGYAVLPAYEGQGYITEATRSALHYIFDTLKIKKVLAITNVDNAGSIRVLEKIGFQFLRYMTMPGEDKAVRLFEVVEMD